MEREIREHLGFGPGGIKCDCCAPAPGKRRKKFRRARRKAKRLALKAGTYDALEQKMEMEA